MLQLEKRSEGPTIEVVSHKSWWEFKVIFNREEKPFTIQILGEGYRYGAHKILTTLFRDVLKRPDADAYWEASNIMKRASKNWNRVYECRNIIEFVMREKGSDEE